MANELHSPAEQLSYQYHLASDRVAEAGGEGGAGSPAEEAEDSSNGARAAVEGYVEGPVDRGADRGGVQGRSGEVEEQEGREEDRPGLGLVRAPRRRRLPARRPRRSPACLIISTKGYQLHSAYQLCWLEGVKTNKTNYC